MITIKKDTPVENEIEALLGKSEEEVKEALTQAKIPFRVTMRDGIPCMVTFDYVPNRHSLVIEKGCVKEILKE